MAIFLVPLEKKILGHLLDMASVEFSNHGCNDLDSELIKLINQNEYGPVFWHDIDEFRRVHNGYSEEDIKALHGVASDFELFTYFKWLIGLGSHQYDELSRW